MFVIFQHEEYLSNKLYDIALIKLVTRVTFTANISSVCLPMGRVANMGNMGIVTGWGTTSENGNVADKLQQVAVTVLNNTVCSSLQNYNTTLNLCAGEPENPIRDSCQGDSGGPFVMKDNSTGAFYLAGVVSTGVGCRGKGVYMRVSSFESWILQTILLN